MFCENCGKPMDENQKFCPTCGAKNSAAEEAAAESVPEIAAENGTAPESGSQKPPKKKGGKKALTAAIIAAVLVVALAISAFASPFVGNLLAKTFMSPEKYFVYVQKENTKDIAKALSESMALVRDANGSAMSGKADVELTMGDGLKQLLNEQGGAEAAMYTSWINSVGIGYGASVDGDLMGADAKVRLNGTELATMNVAMDMEAGMVYMSVPALSETAIGANLGAEMSGGDMSEMMAMLEEFYNILPEEKVMEELLCRYMEKVAEQVTNVDRKPDTLTAGDVSQRATLLTAKLSEKTAMKITEAVCEEALDDKEIKKIIKDAARIEALGVDGDELYNEFTSSIEDFLAEIEDYEPSTETVAKLKVWVNGSGEIIGLGVEIEEAEIVFCTVEKGKKFGILLESTIPGAEFILEGDGETEGGKKNGELTLKVNDAEIVTVSLSDIDEKKLEEGMLDGKITIAPSASISGLLDMAGDDMGELAGLLEGLRLEIAAAQESEKAGNVEVSLYSGDALFAALKVNANVEEGGSVTLPATYVDAESEADMEGWLSSANIQGLADKLKAAGMPDALLAPMAAEMGLNMGSTAVGGVLRVGTNAAYPPFEYKEGETYTGFDMALLERLSMDLGFSYEIVDMEFNALLPALGNGQLDMVIAAMVKTDERDAHCDFTEPYTTYSGMAEGEAFSDSYSIALPTGSPLVTVINAKIAEYEANGTLASLRSTWNI